MASVTKIAAYIDSIAPFDTKEAWDNCGVLVGDPDTEVSAAVVVLDITAEAVAAAKKLGAQLIVSHHPVIFEAQKNFCAGSTPFELARAGISAVCCHTPLDLAVGGVNDVLCEKLGFANFEAPDFAPMIRIGEIEATDEKSFADFLAKKLGAAVRFCGRKKTIRTVAVCGGAGMSFLPDIAGKGIDAFVTGDCSHHNFLDAAQSGITVFAAGHFETEFPVVPMLAKKLSEKFEGTSFTVLCENSPIETVK